jgi:membrane fusion protein, heavy metal efflux system
MRNQNDEIQQEHVGQNAEPVIGSSSGDARSHTPPRAAAARIITRHRWLTFAVVLLVVVAIALALFLSRTSSSQAGRPVPMPGGALLPLPTSEGSGGVQPRPGDITLTLSPDKLENAQIKTEVAAAQTGPAPQGAGGTRTTGTVQSNAYKEVPVMPIAGGIVREVNVELGTRVARGQPLATIFSNELAEAQAAYLKGLADVEEHHKHHSRMTELVEIGAASREELEQATSNFKAAQAALASARQRLLLLGMTSAQVEALRGPGDVRSLIAVPAPSSGTVISRTANPGEVVDKGKELFRVADLSTVWVIGQLYESDFAQMRIGMPAVITAQAYPGRTFNGRVSYIDPRVDPQTRTAQVRIEVANPGEMLKIGMFVDVSFADTAPTATSEQRAAVVSRAAIQNIGARQVVFVAADQPGIFIQREVTVGPEANGLVPIYRGVSPGERVVTEGSFLLRAESLKLNPTQPQSEASASPPAWREAQPQSKPQTKPADSVQSVTVRVTAKGFQPEQFKLKVGVLARITLVREVEVTCATEVVFPDFNIKRELPYNEPVVVEITPQKKGEVPFSCGMNMVRGKIIVQ